MESRLHSLRSRQAAAYKGIYALTLGNGARDWMEDKALDMVQYKDLAVDIHHIFPRRWCDQHNIDTERRDSIVNKAAIAAHTNRVIQGQSPSSYTTQIEQRAQIDSARLDMLMEAHLVPTARLRGDDFERFFHERRERLCQLVESAMGKPVVRDLDQGNAQELSDQFDPKVFTTAADEDAD